MAVIATRKSNSLDRWKDAGELCNNNNNKSANL